MTEAEIERLDREDPFAGRRADFAIPEGVIYLDGNSLGPPTRWAAERLRVTAVEEWGAKLIHGWSECGWMELPSRLGDRIAHLIGASPGTVVVADSTSVNLMKALAAALALQPFRRTILTEEGAFPTDGYIAQGLCRFLDRTRRVKAVRADAIEGALNDDTAVLLLTETCYRTARRHDLARLTAAAHAVGALTVWDLAHSAGAHPLDVTAAKADFAVGCGYKYLNGGPGAPAFIYVAPEHANAPAIIPGWMGHAEPFAFEGAYRPAPGATRMRTGTPDILSMRALEAGLDAFEGVDLEALRAKTMRLGDLFIAGVGERPGLTLLSPRDAAARGGHVAYAHTRAQAALEALRVRGVIADFRPPNVLRFGFAALYLSHRDVFEASQILRAVLSDLEDSSAA